MKENFKMINFAILTQNGEINFAILAQNGEINFAG